MHTYIPSFGGHGWDGCRLESVRCGVLFAEPLPLLLPFLRDIELCLLRVRARVLLWLWAKGKEQKATVMRGEY
jgi:hypothetical protein